jgi:hypothetical protein
MHELPQNLLGPIHDFEKAFTVDRSKLKEIVNHFVKDHISLIRAGGSLESLTLAGLRVLRANSNHGDM